VTEKEIDESLENLREQAADFTDVPERGAAMDDFIVVDYEGTIDGEPVHKLFPKPGKPLSGNEDFWIRMTPEAFFPGFAAQLVDAKPARLVSSRSRYRLISPLKGCRGRRSSTK
jgi:FKBP-type peptidyl-prolyl cis-trans isomerase (trigger factor)